MILFVASVLMPSDDDAVTGAQDGPGGAIGGAGRDQHFYAPVNVYSHPASEADASPVIDAVKIELGAAFFRTLHLLPTLSYRLVELQAVRVINNDPERSATLEFSLLGTAVDGTVYATRAVPEGHTQLEWMRNVSVAHHLAPIKVDPRSVLPLEKLCFPISKDAALRLEDADRSIPTTRLRLRADELMTKTHLITTVFDRDRDAAPDGGSMGAVDVRGFQRRGLDILNSLNGPNPSAELVRRAEAATKEWAHDVGAALSVAGHHELALHFAHAIRRGPRRSDSLTASEISRFVGERVQRLGLLTNQRDPSPEHKTELRSDDG